MNCSEIFVMKSTKCIVIISTTASKRRNPTHCPISDATYSSRTKPASQADLYGSERHGH